MLKILLSNDDGVEAKGLQLLYNELQLFAEVFVVSPEINQSGAGSSITTKRPLKSKKVKDNFLSINGSPADCVFLGLNNLCPFKPDLVVSGVNAGSNMGEDLLYSGTIGAALEGRSTPMPCIAVSAAYKQKDGKDIEPNFRTAVEVTKKLIQNITSLDINPSITLNVNVPHLEYAELSGIVQSEIGSWGPRNPPHIEIQANGEKKYWISHRSKHPINADNSDIKTLLRGMVSVTPLIPNFLSSNANNLSSWLKL